MALDQSHRTFGKVTKVFATKLKSFTFVPALKKLPIKNRVASNYKTALQTSRPNKTLGEPEDSEGSKMDEGIYKAEVVYIQDPEEDKPGETFTNSTQSEIQPTNLAPNPPATLTGPYKEFGSLHRKTSPATMETIDTKQACVSHLGFHNTSAGAEVSSGLCLNSMSQREDVLSPASSLGFLTSPASSKESILSEGWDKERSWSALYMLSPDGSPVPFSRTVSPCSSVRSGTFTPSVLRIKRHTLAPGSSLVQMSPTCGTPCCDSRGTSPCPLSPRSRHRPPPTQLSLLTAILRKGRLPVLSSAFQRPYTPCWPISPVNMSSCLACSAASAVAPMDVSKAKSCTSINRSCSESCHNSKPLKPVIYSQSISSPAQEPDKSVATPLKTPDKLDYHRYVTNSGGISPVKCSPLTSQSLPTVPAHLSKSGHKDTHFSGVPSLLSNTSFSRLRSMSPKSNSPTCRSPDSQKAPPVSSDYTVFKDQKDANGLDNYLPSSILKNKHITHDLSEKLSSGVRQRSELSPEPSLKQNASDYSTSSASKPAQNSHKCSSSIAMNLPAESRDNASPVLNNTESKQGILLQNGKKISSDLERVRLSSPAFSLSPSPRPVGLTRLSYTPPVSPACVSNYPNSRSSTPDRCTLSPSPGVPSRQLSPSPAYSYCSSPSSSMWGSTSDCTDRDSKNRKLYKIKSTYKALAAIPTNTLLMEQQAIDDEVNKKEALLNPADNYAWEDPHSEMCSPAQLRQQSAELYATIDEVLEDSIQRPQSHHVNKPTVKSLATEAPRSLTSSPSPRLLGRETKYANSYLQPPVPTEKTLTKPGVIRPVIVTSRLHDDKEDEKFHPNPFTINQDNTSSRYHYKFISGTLCDETEADGGGVSVKQSASRERLLSDGRGNSSKTSLASLITQTRGSPQNVPTSIITSHTEPQETHI